MCFKALKNKKILVFILVIIILGVFLIVFAPKIKFYLADQYRLEGKNYLIAGDYEKARESYNKVLKLDPECSVAYYQLGNIFGRFEDYNNAEEYFN